ncbi:hypothetical protein [Psychroserpens sp.]|uniref:hypothetical protein n=1 Tax=Psychroserpens sp. TaxID=2020870 RepID=UPI001B274EBB|nr:hypothetical protein [Psychroserpens sp.]MBO6606549.1 hypothetical protein [Psychroserpens sp.]MBO6631681.1 hypothetical protein [Psychroserpens sp.]MBO6653253.1 hypothetical protein [Psychroserpens sp.]MBO6680720.1 hypothetical protein [Psychroserpens sp.]MBO6750322.1 hypothetical protein [Psychroserpens sp.]
MNLSKNKKLILSILLDAFGMIPFIDIVWAPLSGYLMTKLYKGDKGKLAGIISFIEEIIPGTDFIPTFTLMWLYTYVFSSQRAQNDNIIDISK